MYIVKFLKSISLGHIINVNIINTIENQKCCWKNDSAVMVCSGIYFIVNQMMTKTYLSTASVVLWYICVLLILLSMFILANMLNPVLQHRSRQLSLRPGDWRITRSRFSANGSMCSGMWIRETSS